MREYAQDVAGDVDAQPAVAGSYGQAPGGFRLPAATRLGEVRLQVTDLARSLEFYEKTLGLRVASRDGVSARLAPHDDDRVLVELRERRGQHTAGRQRHLGLYHFAILLPDRLSLGRFVRHLAESGTRAGAGDHVVSEAFYLTDPDGLGIEVYADRPRELWRRRGRELVMATDPVDVAGLAALAEGSRWNGMPAGTTIGHVHLHVGDLGDAAAFYSEALGFDRMTWSLPGALFLAAGGYHHHLGTNTWAGPSARPPSPEEPQLLEWTLELPDEHSVTELTNSLTKSGFRTERDATGDAKAHDPWGTAIRVRTAAGSSRSHSPTTDH